jgi:hypothetical protein
MFLAPTEDGQVRVTSATKTGPVLVHSSSAAHMSRSNVVLAGDCHQWHSGTTIPAPSGTCPQNPGAGAAGCQPEEFNSFIGDG